MRKEKARRKVSALCQAFERLRTLQAPLRQTDIVRIPSWSIISDAAIQNIHQQVTQLKTIVLDIVGAMPRTRRHRKSKHESSLCRVDNQLSDSKSSAMFGTKAYSLTDVSSSPSFSRAAAGATTTATKVPSNLVRVDRRRLYEQRMHLLLICA